MAFGLNLKFGYIQQMRGSIQWDGKQFKLKIFKSQIMYFILSVFELSI